MNDTAAADDWARDIAERIVGDIPHAIFVRWAADVPERVAMMLRREAASPSSDARLNGLVEEIVRSLPDYVSAPVAARFRAKLLGALLTAGALGLHFRRVAPLPAGELASLASNSSTTDGKATP